MVSIVKTEFLKLKRYSILWAGVALMFLTILLTQFTSMADDGSVWDYVFWTEQVIKNLVTLIFPMCITLVTGYIINRENTNDTLKNIVTIPISFQRLLVGKLVTGGILSVFLGSVCFVFTTITSIAKGYDGLTLGTAIPCFFQMVFVTVFLYLAVLPIIVATSRLNSGFLAGVILAFVYGFLGMFIASSKTLAPIFPITAALGMIRYRSYDSASIQLRQLPLCCMSFAVMILLTIVLIKLNSKPKEMGRKQDKKAYKKGW